NSEGIHHQIFYQKRFIFPDLPENPLRDLSKRAGTHHGVHSSARCINGYAVFPRDHSKTFDMVGVFVCDKNTVQIPSCELQTVQARLHSAAADSRVDQHMGAVGTHINTVPAAAACNAA